MLASLKSKLVLGAAIIIFAACLAFYLYLTNLQENYKLLEAKTQSQELVINSYAENAEITRQFELKKEKVMVDHRVALDNRIKRLNDEKNLIKRKLDEANNECLNSRLPDSILDSLYQ